MDKFEEITRARKVLELPESATMAEVRSSYRRLVKRWHPDTSDRDCELCTEKTREITEAYKTILSYLSGYRFSFSEQEVQKYESGEEWWLRRFGDDPLWGRGK